MDLFINFAELAKHAVEGRDFCIETRPGRSNTAIMAPHGGGIEPGTDIIASAIAGDRHGFYAFKGLRARDNKDLHISSDRFDEPRGLALACRSVTVVTVHGCSTPEAVVYVGGLDQDLKHTITERLLASDFQARKSPHVRLNGVHPENLCNRCRKGKGVQLELSGHLRQKLLPAFQYGPSRVYNTLFKSFVAAIAGALK